MTFSNIHIDHFRPISSFNISNGEELFEAFNWVNTKPLLKVDKLKKHTKFSEKQYRDQFKNAREFNFMNTFLNITDLH